MDRIRATPYINPLLGSVNELVGGLLGYMRDPRRTQQMQGLAGLLESTGVPKTLERLAYGEPLTNIQRANVPVLRPETAEALLTLSPVPQATSRAAMAAGRAGERMAERVVPQIMERGGMPAGLLEGMSSRTVSPLTVYHGSPHKFEKFDASKIGTGEGAQSYGYGHYVAESPKVADEYRMMLSTHKVTGEAAQDLANYSLRMKPTIEEAINYLQKEKKTAINQSKASSNEFATDEYVKQYDDAIALLRSNKGEKAGNLYTIDLPDEQIARMLDWDKPLSEQPTEVKNFLSKVSFNPPRKDQPIGEWLKPRLSEGMSPYWSEDLRKAGIPGIRYLDQGSRGAGEGTSNFVVFPGNEGLLTIQKRNNEVIAPTSLLDNSKNTFETSVTDASEIFGEGAKRIRYTDPSSGGMIDVLQRPDGTASVLGLEVPEAMRGQGIGQSLQSQVMQDFPEMMGQVSSKAAAKTAYRLGRRPPNQPDATLDDVYKIMDEYSSVNLVSPEMQKRFMQSLLD
jgi:predicted GNAT family acetyltransferase